MQNLLDYHPLEEGDDVSNSEAGLVFSSLVNHLTRKPSFAKDGLEDAGIADAFGAGFILEGMVIPWKRSCG